MFRLPLPLMVVGPSVDAMAADRPEPALHEEANRCLRSAFVSLRHFRSNSGEVAKARLLIEVAYRVWPENPRAILPYTELLLAEGRLDDAGKYLVHSLADLTSAVSIEARRAALVVYCSYLAQTDSEGGPPGRLEEVLSIDPADSLLRAMAVAGLQLPATSDVTELMARFEAAVSLQPSCPQLVAQAGLPLLQRRAQLASDDEVRLFHALCRATFLPLLITELCDLSVRHQASVAARSLAEVATAMGHPVEGLDRGPSPLPGDPAARAVLDSADWGFLPVVAHPEAFVSLAVIPARPRFAFDEVPSLTVRLRNRAAARVPLGTPSWCSGVVYVYGWSIAIGDSAKFKNLVHCGLSSCYYPFGTTIPPQGEVSQILDVGSDLTGSLFDMFPLDSWESYCFAVVGIDDDLAGFNRACQPALFRMAEAASDLRGELPAVEYHHPRGGVVLFSPISRFERSGLPLSEETLDQVLRQLGSRSSESVWKGLDTVRRLVGVLEQAQQETRASTIRQSWLPALLPRVHQLLQSPEPALRVAATRVLSVTAKAGIQRFDTPALRRVLTDPHWYVRFGALLAAADAGDVCAPSPADWTNDLADWTNKETDSSVLSLLRLMRREDRPGGAVR